MNTCKMATRDCRSGEWKKSVISLQRGKDSILWYTNNGYYPFERTPEILNETCIDAVVMEKSETKMKNTESCEDISLYEKTLKEKRGNMEYRIPIENKLTLTIREAAEYSNIGINRIEKMLRQPNCPFALYVGSKKIVKRKEFEAYVSNCISI